MNGFTATSLDQAAQRGVPDFLGRSLSLGATNADEFGSLLRQSAAATSAAGATNPAETDEERARTAAEQFVSIAFVQPLLKQLREGRTFAAPPFAPSQAENQFRGLADQALADRIVSASNWPLVDRIASDLIKKSVGLKQSTSEAAPPPNTSEQSS